jgi:hypothetical protein
VFDGTAKAGSRWAVYWLDDSVASTANAVSFTTSITGATATVTLTKSADVATWTTLINGLAYVNTSDAPTNGNRVITLTSLKDAGGTSNGGADTKTLNLTSTVAVLGTDSTPVLSVNTGASVQDGGLVNISVSTLSATDADSAAEALVYTVGTTTTKGTLFLDKNANNDVDSGETLDYSAEFTQADVAAGKLKYFHTGSTGLLFALKDA